MATGLSDRFMLEYTGLPWGMKGMMEQMGFCYVGKKRVYKTYGDYDEMIEDRQAVIDYFSKFGRKESIDSNAKHITPYNRFSPKVC